MRKCAKVIFLFSFLDNRNHRIKNTQKKRHFLLRSMFRKSALFIEFAVVVVAVDDDDDDALADVALPTASFRGTNAI